MVAPSRVLAYVTILELTVVGCCKMESSQLERLLSTDKIITPTTWFRIWFYFHFLLKYSALYFSVVIFLKGESITKEKWKMEMPTYPLPSHFCCSPCTVFSVELQILIFQNQHHRLLLLNYWADFPYPLRFKF